MNSNTTKDHSFAGLRARFGCSQPKLLVVFTRAILLLLGLTPISQLRADVFDPLALGLGAITQGSPGAVFGVQSNWVTIVGGDDDSSQPSSFVMARTYGRGRVVVLGQDGMLSDSALSLLDNGRLMTNIVFWLRGTNGSSVQYSTGHGEWASGLPLQKFLTNAGFTITAMPAPISSNKLAAGAVLIVGNAWSDFTSNEIDSVGQFVSQGGGLLLAGLGWSWSAYHSGMTMEDYPMTKLAAPYGGRWLKQGITDPTNQTNGAPVFHTFYPNGLACTPFGAIAVITNAHLTYGNNLPAVLETNVTLRTSFVGAHAALSMPSIELPASDSMRLSVFDFCFSLIQNWPAAYARTGALDQALYPTSVWLRERLWRSARDSAPLTPERKLLLADAAQLTGKYRDLFLDFGIVLLDNCRLVTNQLGYLYTLIALVPPELHSLQSISVTEFLGNPPLSISLEGASYGVNIFGAAITSGPIENQFPSDVSAGYSKIFCSAAAHELNHIVDACTVGWSSASSLANRRAQLISDAGTNHLNYLRSGGADGFFVSAPQEFFASIANQWFTDSAKVLELAKVCFQAGRSNPINQALFFAEVYSRGGQSTYFYNTDLDGYLSRKEIPLRRDQQGCITGLQSGDTFYSFTLNQNSNVTALTTTLTSPPALACSVSNSTLRLSWPEIPLGYELEYTPGLTSPFWLPLTNKPVSWAGSQTVTVSLDSDLSFFRLRSLSASP